MLVWQDVGDKEATMALAPERLEASAEDLDGVRRAATDYIEAYVQGDPERHARAYHPECVKRRLTVDPETGVAGLIVLSPQIMVDHAATGKTVIEDCEYEIVIDAVSEDIASVRVYSCRWVDFTHLAKQEANGVFSTSLGTVTTTPLAERLKRRTDDNRALDAHELG